MSNLTQAERFKQQFKVPQSPSKLTKELLLKNLTQQSFHGKKVDIPVEWIETADNQRYKLEDIEALKQQIKHIGLVQPVGIQCLDERITLVYGHRRLKAYPELAVEDPEKYALISCLLQVYEQPEQGRVIAQTLENLGRSDLAPLDECKAIAELKAVMNSHGKAYSNEQLGELLGGIHRKTIDLAVIIANWPEAAHKLIQQEQANYSISLLRSIAKKGLHGQELFQALRQKVASNEAKTANTRLSELQQKKYYKFLHQNSFTPKQQKFLRKQQTWLGDSSLRRAMLKALTEHFS